MRSTLCPRRDGTGVPRCVRCTAAKVSEELLKLIDQLGETDATKRAEANEKLIARGDDALPTLRRHQGPS